MKVDEDDQKNRLWSYKEIVELSGSYYGEGVKMARLTKNLEFFEKIMSIVHSMEQSKTMLLRWHLRTFGMYLTSSFTLMSELWCV